MKHQKQRLDNQGTILGKTSKILDTLKEAHVEHMGLPTANHGMAAVASYIRWRGDNIAVDHLEKENMIEFYEG